jgi:hypothetical protein
MFADYGATRMKHLILAMAMIGLGLTSAQAGVDPPWCARGDGHDYYENCGYYTWQQCMASVSGVGGGCFPNPRAHSYFEERAYPRRKGKRTRGRRDY